MRVLTWSTDLHFTCSKSENNMVLTKAYLRYVQSACFGVVCSLKANIVFVRRRNNKASKQVTLYAVCPTLESVVVWDVRRGEKVRYIMHMKQSVLLEIKAQFCFLGLIYCAHNLIEVKLRIFANTAKSI